MERDRHYSYEEIAELVGCDKARAKKLAEKLCDLTIPDLHGEGETILPLLCDENGITLLDTLSIGVDQPIRLDRMQAIATTLALRMTGVTWDDTRMHALCEGVATDAPIEHLSHIIDVSPTAYASEVLEVLAQAKLDGCCVKIIHKDTERIIEPWVLLAEQDKQYEYAWCQLREAPRMFRLDRIQGAELLPHLRATHIYEEAPPLELQAYPDLDEAAYCARLYFSDPDAYNPLDWTGARVLHSTRPGLTIELPYNNPRWIAKRVVAALGEVEVVAPAEVREAVIEHATRLRSVCCSGR